MKKMLATPIVAGAVLIGTATIADAQEAQTTPPVDEATSGTDDDDDGGKIGLIGLAGLLGLAGLAGLKRRDAVVSRYETMPNPPR